MITQPEAQKLRELIAELIIRVRANPWSPVINTEHDELLQIIDSLTEQAAPDAETVKTDEDRYSNAEPLPSKPYRPIDPYAGGPEWRKDMNPCAWHSLYYDPNTDEIVAVESGGGHTDPAPEPVGYLIEFKDGRRGFRWERPDGEPGVLLITPVYEGEKL